MMDDAATLGEAREWLRARVKEGERCPCCTQFAKIYRRNINSGMARALITQWRYARYDYAHTAGLARWTHEAAQLVWWGLLESEGIKREDGGRTAWHRITPQGGLFVTNDIRVPKYAVVYDGRLMRLEGKNIGIMDALGKRFNYRELMDDAA
jgi:hypothetical protein